MECLQCHTVKRIQEFMEPLDLPTPSLLQTCFACIKECCLAEPTSTTAVAVRSMNGSLDRTAGSWHCRTLLEVKRIERDALANGGGWESSGAGEGGEGCLSPPAVAGDVIFTEIYGAHHVVNVTATTPLNELQSKLEMLFKVPLRNQKLLYNGRDLLQELRERGKKVGGANVYWSDLRGVGKNAKIQIVYSMCSAGHGKDIQGTDQLKFNLVWDHPRLGRDGRSPLNHMNGICIVVYSSSALSHYDFRRYCQSSFSH